MENRKTAAENSVNEAERIGVFMLSSGEGRDTMSATNDGSDGMTEECEECRRETPHEVSVQILTESATPENAEYSREPYRVSECRICGSRTTIRMNNA